MPSYTATVEVARRGPLTNDQVDAAMADLADYAPSLAETARGHNAARITLPSNAIGPAARLAALLVEQALGSTVISLEVMTEAEADARDGMQPVPDLVGTPEAAELLGVTQQRVRQMIAEGKLAAHRVGERSLALVRTEVIAYAARV